MTVESNKEERRRESLTRMWAEKHPGEQMSRSDQALLDALVFLGREYDEQYNHNSEKERFLYNRSNQVRGMLGLRVPISDNSKEAIKKPRRENYIRKTTMDKKES
jgi:hypothetical protein